MGSEGRRWFETLGLRAHLLSRTSLFMKILHILNVLGLITKDVLKAKITKEIHLYKQEHFFLQVSLCELCLL